ncbi:MAG: hypothetical protein ACRDRI_24115 [Pseudonocardiaceae bacterium]
MGGRHRLRTWRRHRRGASARDRWRSRLAGVTDAGTLVGHLVTGDAAGDGRGRYVAVCGAWVLPASLTAERGFCLACVGGAP